MSTSDEPLLDRRSERAALDELLASVRSGSSRALVLRGVAGVGKSALLNYLEQQAARCRLVRTAGVESQMELARAGLHQLCAQFVDRFEILPGPQRDALDTALGLRDGDALDRFRVGLAVLCLLSELAGPLDERVRDRIVAETCGNPLALLELPRGRSPVELAGGFDLDDERALAGRLEQSFRDRVAPMPAPTRRLLLIAAAESTGDPLL